MQKLDEMRTNTRIITSSLWVAMLFIFAYVDIFAFYRKDVLENTLAGKVFIFEANQVFFLLTTIYIIIPSLMVFLTLVLKAKLARISNIVLPILYIFTIAGSMVGEAWWYFLLGSVVEILLLTTLMIFAWKWPRETPHSVRA